MLVYHGSNLAVQMPRLIPQNRFLDFGFGFYTTTNREQAVSFAEKVTRRRRQGTSTVSIYEFDENDIKQGLNILQFSHPDERWLDFVSAHRSGTYHGPIYDLICGPVANDDVYQTFTLYSNGLLTKDQTLEALKIKRLYDQYVWSTEQALACLKFLGTLDTVEG